MIVRWIRRILGIRSPSKEVMEAWSKAADGWDKAMGQVAMEMECRERGVSREEARMAEIGYDAGDRGEPEHGEEPVAKGEVWTCVCGNVVLDSFACPACKLTVIGSDMAREHERLTREKPKIKIEVPADSGWTIEQQGSDIELVMVDKEGNPVGDHDAGAGEGEDGVVVARAGAEEGGYTHEAIYIMMLVSLALAIACIGGLIIGKAVYGV